MILKSTYNFPSGTVKVFIERSCRLFPHWFPSISTPIERGLLAQAIQELRGPR